MIYLDNAATTYPKPPEVLKTFSEAAEKFYANPGRGGYPAAELSEQAVFSARKTAAVFFGATSPENVVFTPGCTAAVNYVLKGCLSPGDHIIISDLEHNAVVRPLYSLERRGVQVTRVRTFGCEPAAVVRGFLSAIRRNTRMIFCTGASNVFGTALPVNDIGKICRENGLIFGIDAAQSAGLTPLSLTDSSADFICAPAHKSLYGVMGLGVLVCSGRVLPRSIIEGGTGSLSAHRSQPDYLPDLLESGTLNVPGICALEAGMNAVSRAGVEKICRQELTLMQYAFDELRRIPGVRLYAPRPVYGRSVPLLSFNVGSLSGSDAGAALSDMGIAVRAGYHCAYDAHLAAGTAERGTVRICPSMFTTEEDIRAMLRAVYHIAVRQ